MAEQQIDGRDANTVTVALQRIYLKDSSFEAPNSPAIFSGNWRPNIGLNIGSKVNELGEDNYECVLSLTVEAKHEDKTAFLIEVQQAGIFLLQGLAPADLERALMTFCPQQLYPYAREVIADLSGKGGFPSLSLQPVNFEALAAEAQRQRQANEAQQPGANAPAPDTQQ